MQLLRDRTQIVLEAVTESSGLVNQLTTDMADDSVWTSESKKPFMAWMDLLRQYHEQLAGLEIGQSATQRLDDFLSRLSTYTQDSTVYTSLGDV